MIFVLLLKHAQDVLLIIIIMEINAAYNVQVIVYNVILVTHATYAKKDIIYKMIIVILIKEK